MIAIVTLTRGGAKTATYIKKIYKDAVIYTKKELCSEDMKPLTLPLKNFVGTLFQKYKKILFIMATGIVVRVIAPYVQHKSIDPAILVMDEKGQYIISLLSGHIGGANELAKELAMRVNAIPVITTSSDVNEVKAVDIIAKDNNLKLLDFEKAKEITAKVVNGDTVGVISDIPLLVNLQSPYILYKHKENLFKDFNNKKIVGVVVISSKKLDIPFDIPSVQLVPQNIVLGIGCKKGKTYEEIFHVIIDIFDKNNLYLQSIKKIGTAWVKENEIGLIEIAKKLNIPLEIFSKEEIKKVEDLFDGSDFVKKTIGVQCVCEPTGYLASNKGKCLKKKVKCNGITLSLWEMEGN